MSLLRAAFQLSFQLSPIILTNGIATNMPQGILPIIALTEALNFTDGILGGANINLDSFFANFEPLPGATLVDQEVGHYPFANQAVAANAVIAQPLKISMRMICPVRDTLGYAVKLATMMALQTALNQHNSSGGTYTIATPSYFYTNCLMLNFRDVTSGGSNQTQYEWQMDFEQPLLTLQQAQQAQNALMSKITGGTAVSGTPAWSGPATVIGQSQSLGAIGVVPAASGAGGAGVSGLTSALGFGG